MSKTTFNPGPPPEALRYLEEKGLKPSFDWRDVWGEEHAIAFTVAKSTGFDILEDIHAALHEAMELGLPFAEFRKRLEPKLKARGWWGVDEVTDPLTGEVKLARLGSRRRLKIIYEANMRTARAAGQWERAQRTKEMLPYFEYRLGPSRHHRAQHAAWAAAPVILPVDDPFWNTHYPPNGWGCKCWLRQITEREARRRGGPTERPPVIWRDYVNPRDGRTWKVPDGIDPGWQTNPGKARARQAMRRYFDRLDHDGGGAAASAMREFWKAGVWRAWMRMKERVHMPAALLPAAAEALGSVSPVVSISNDTLAAKTRKHAGPHHPAPAARAFLEVLDNLPELIRDGTWLGEMRPGEVWIAIEWRGRHFKVVLKKSRNGYLHVQTIQHTDPARIRAWKQKRQ